MPNYRRLFIDNSYLFITIVTYQRKPILIDNVELLRESFKEAKSIYNFELYASVIMPDHLHMILIPENIKEYPKIIRAVKYNFSKEFGGGIAIPPYQKESIRMKKEIWQKRYWEHTIRDEEDLYRHLDYIYYNPIKHDYVRAAKDWGFSSFDKFVKLKFYDPNWCCEENIEKILEMDLE